MSTTSLNGYRTPGSRLTKNSRQQSFLAVPLGGIHDGNLVLGEQILCPQRILPVKRHRGGSSIIPHRDRGGLAGVVVGGAAETSRQRPRRPCERSTKHCGEEKSVVSPSCVRRQIIRAVGSTVRVVRARERRGRLRRRQVCGSSTIITRGEGDKEM